MRIDALQNVAQIYSGTSSATTNAGKKASERDKLQISQSGIDYQIAKKAVAETSDIREDLVTRIKNEVDSGSYDVSGDDFAAKVIERYNQLML